MSEADAFSRQRRNVILMSIFVLILNGLDADVEKLSLLGNDIKLGNPTALPKVLFAFLVYFLLRYVQYLSEIGGLSKLASRINEQAWRWFSPQVKRLAKSEYARLSKEGKLKATKVRMAASFGPSPRSKQDARDEPVVGWQQQGHWAVQVYVDNEAKEENYVFTMRFGPFRRLPYIFIAGPAVAVKSTLVTEYVLPPLLGLIALASFSEPVSKFLRSLL